MKKSGTLLILVFMIGIVSAVPYVLFMNPTPSNNANIDDTTFEINVTTTSVSSLQEFIFQWQGTNYSFYNDSLILHLNLNNNSALGENDTLVYDSSAFGNNGTVTSATFTSSGKYEGGFSFDADNELINLSNNNIFSSENFSVSMWINLEDMNVKQVSAFGQTTCVLLNSGEAYCVGQNDQGQLGDGTTTNNAIPQLVLGSHNFSKLDNAGYPDPDHMCGIIQNGSAYCWGDNSQGQLGDNSTTDSSTPVFVNGTHNFTEISCGRYHTCGRLVNGTVLCWGDNSLGALGDGGTTDSTIPIPVSGGHVFKKISAGDYASCGILTNGTALCWGRNSYGALGDGTTTQRNSPTPVSGNHNFNYLMTGNTVSCGILTNGTALCWGGNQGGSYLGNGLNQDSSTPVPVFGNYNFSYLEQDYIGVCGVLTNGSVLCWGLNSFGQVGDGTIITRLYPTSISGDYNFSSVSLGYGHICGILTNGTIFCWGRDTNYQLGKGVSLSSFKLPVLFGHGNISSNSYSEIYSGASHSCGLFYDDSAKCWGLNAYGELGDNSTDDNSKPVSVVGNYNFTSLTIGGSILRGYTCGILTNGTALCWGDNQYGQLGNNTAGGYSSIPISVYGNYNFSQLVGNYYHTCGLLHNGTALCWGLNGFGRLGNGTTGGTFPYPVLVAGNYNFSSLYSGSNYMCGLLHNGTALCWGRNNYGQFGDNSAVDKDFPTLVSGNYNFSSLGTGVQENCGLLHNGTALCWGRNLRGGVGDNTTTQRLIPTLVFGNYNFSQIIGGNLHSCGILTNGTALCWGSNTYGQIGDGTLTERHVPTSVNLDQAFSSLSSFSGPIGFLGVLTDGRIVGWGDNSNGQLGFPSFNSKIPTSGIYKGIVFGRDTSSFRISSTFEGNLRIFVGYDFSDLFLNSGWNYITLTYNGTIARVYQDGSLVDSFDPPIFSWYNDTSSLIIGEDSRGTIDEVAMWNRTLTASEIAQMYNANLKQINFTAWNFYTNKSSLSRETTYSYGGYAKDSSGTKFSGLRYLFVNALPTATTPARQEGSGGGGRGFITYSPTEEELSKGYFKYLKERDEIIIPYTEVSVEISDVDFYGGKVSFSVDEENYGLDLNEIVKIDSDSDGYYDLEISVNGINDNGYAYMEFKEISEEVESEKEEIVDENIEVDEKNGNNFWIYSLVVVIVLGIVFYSWKRKDWKK